MTTMAHHQKADVTTVIHLLLLHLKTFKLLYPKYANVLVHYFARFWYKSCLRGGWLSGGFKCVTVPDRLFNKIVLKNLLHNNSAHALEHCALISNKSAKFADTCPDNCVFISIALHNNRPQPIRYIEVVPLKGLPPQEILLSETMFHNLKSSLKCNCSGSIHRLFCHNREPLKVVTLQFAVKAVVGLVQSAIEIPQDLLKQGLSTYFEKPHVLCVGDIFVIDLPAIMPEVVYASGLENTNYIYFKVEALEGPCYDGICEPEVCIGYLVAKGETTLMQIKTQSYIPRTMFLCTHNEYKMTTTNYRDNMLPLCPPSLVKLKNTIIEAFMPFFNDSEASKVYSIKPIFWLIGPSGSGKHSLLSSLSNYFGTNLLELNCDEAYGKAAGQIEGKLKAFFTKARSVTPCIIILSDIQLLCTNAEGQEDSRIISFLNNLLSEDSKFPLIVVACSNKEVSVSPTMARIFLQTFTIPSLDETERKKQIQWFVRLRKAEISDEGLNLAVSRSSGFLLADLDTLVAHAVRNSAKREKPIDEFYTKSDINLTRTDFEDALDTMQSAYSDAIGAPKIPAVSWNDVGGLTSVKEEILRTVNTPLHHPELVAAGLRRSGVLLYGPPGTGKTLIAKAVATECSLNFLSVKGPELLNMYVGQSEENVREGLLNNFLELQGTEVFERARAASPCIIFFDELDSLAPNRGRSGDSAGVMDRVVSQLLAEMDGLQKSTHLFVIGATNRPDLIDPALLRPGRFDKLLYVSACEDAESIACVMRALTRKFVMSSDVNIDDLSEKIPKQVTGADIYAVCSNAWRNAVRRAIKLSMPGKKSESTRVEVSSEDFLSALSEMTPSVSVEDMKYFKNLQQELFGTENNVQATYG